MDNNIIVRNVDEEVKQNKLNYSYSINLYRSFPNLLDGLKVVNRRILYSADKMGLSANKPHKKSVTLVGTSIVYHPHSDSSIYDACAKMVQNFYTNAPLMDGQGSWGTPSGDGAAAQRYCMTGDSLVVTDSGIKEIKDIINSVPNSDNDINIKVPSMYNKINRAIKYFNCGEHEVSTLKTELGYEITVTDNHPLMTYKYENNDIKFEWKLMSDIEEGDYIVLNGGRYNNTTDLISKTEAKFLGSMVSEGYISNNQQYYRIGFGNSNMDFVEDVTLFMQELYPDNKICVNDNSTKNNSLYKDVCFYSREKYEELISKYDFKPYSESKEIPKVVLQSSVNIQREFLRYLFEGDGCISISYAENNKNKRLNGGIIYSSNSKKLVTQIQQLLLNSFNILSSIQYSNKRNRNEYRVVIESKNDIVKFKNNIGFVYNEKNKRLDELVELRTSNVSIYAKTPKGYFFPNVTQYVSKNKLSKTIGLKGYRNINSKEVLIEIQDKLKEGLPLDKYKIIDDIINNDFYLLKVKSKTEKFTDTVYSIRVDSDCHSFIANGMVNHNTEIRLSRYGQEMLEGLHKNTVNWVESALGDDKEPVTLPVKYPNLLINGSYGIGQGYNCFVPTHNLNEVLDMTIDLIKDPTIDQEEIIKRITPDFPLGGVIINGEELKDVYRKGYGVCKVRGEVEKDEKNNCLIIKSFPHIRTNLNSIKDAIGDKVKDGQLQGISDIKDLTKKNDINLVIKAKRGYSLDKLEQELYRLTPLQSTLSLSFMCTEDDKTFRHYAIKEIFTKWIDYRKLTIKRSLNFDMAGIHKRLHIIEALLKALIDIDRVITIIKKSANKQESIDNLIKDKKFGFNILQARYIVDLPLSQLSRIGKESLEKEQEELETKLENLVELFTNDKKLSNMIIKELQEGKKKYGRERRTKVTNIDTEGEEILDKDYTIFLTHEGFIKKLDLELNTQSSGTKGRKCGKLKKNDYIINAINSHNTDTLLFVTNKGNCYGVKVHEVDEVGLSTLGIDVESLINFKDDEKVVNMINVPNSEFEKSDNYLLFITNKGLIKKTKLSHYEKANKNSLIAIKLNEEDFVQETLIVNNNDEVLVATNTGRYTRYSVSEVNESLRMTIGVMSMAGLSNNEEIVSATKLSNKDYVLVIDQRGLAKRIHKEDVVQVSRTNKGKLLTKTDSYVVKVTEVNEDEEVSIITKNKMLKVAVKSIKESIRTSKGKPVIMLEKEDEVLDIIVE